MRTSPPERPAPVPEASRWSRWLTALGAGEALERTLDALERRLIEGDAYLRRSSLMAWPAGRFAADELIMAPPDLRVADPSFVDELRFGNFGLAGEIADLGGRSPFQQRSPSQNWARELNGFGWLRHLDAVRSPEVEGLARRLVSDWLQHGRRDRANAWAPDVIGRRLGAWLAHSALLLDATEPRFYAAVMKSLHQQAAYLSAVWRNAPEGYPRLVALVGLVLADLCIAGRDRALTRSERALAGEIERQILADGGHVGRNAETVVELVLDLLPVRQCFLLRDVPPSGALQRALDRMVPMLRHVRLGDGSLARFNGVGATDRDLLATVLAYDKGHDRLPALAPQSRYARLERGAAIALIDVGTPPPPAFGHSAHAGCLAFELSIGGEPMFVNNGAPGVGNAGQRAAARATASHNTLCIKEQSSSVLVRRGRAGRGALAIEHPDHVTCDIAETGAGVTLVATHDGYVGRWGLVHARHLALDLAGGMLLGSDQLLPAKGVLRFSWDLPFAVHFHLHPDVEVWPGDEPDKVDLVLKSGAHWRLSGRGAALTIEPSVYGAGIVTALAGQQVVLRAACHGEAKVDWQLVRMPPGLRPQATATETVPLPSLGERLALADMTPPALPRPKP